MYPAYARVYDADYQIMFFPGTLEYPSMEKLEEIYMGIYDVILGKEKMKKYLKLTFD